MGVTGLFELLKAKFPETLHSVKFYQPFHKTTLSLRDRQTYIDVSIYLTKAACRGNTLQAAVKNIRDISSLMENLTLKEPVLVVDGRSRVKEKVLYTSFARDRQKTERMKDPKFAEFFSSGWRDRFSEEAYKLNLTVFESPDGLEGEQVCANLAARNGQGIVITEDSDALVFGAPTMIKGIPGKEGVMIDLKEVLNRLEITREQLIDISLMTGCDFASKIPGVGINRALEGIKQHGCIEKFIEHRKRTDKNWHLLSFFEDSFGYVKGRQIFMKQMSNEALYPLGTEEKMLHRVVKKSNMLNK
jgi:XPG I-region